MRILLVHNRYQNPGGEDVVFAAEAALLRYHGHEVDEYTEDNQRIIGLSPLAVAAHTIWSRASRRKIFRILQQGRFDVAHFYNTFLLISPSAYYACKEAGVPVVQTLHNYRLLCPAATFYRDGRPCEDCLGTTLPWPGVVHACYRNSRAETSGVAAMMSVHKWLKTWQKQVDIYIILTEFARRKFIEGGLPPEKLVLKPNFVHPDPGARDSDRQYALFVGRLSREKGISTLLRAWQFLQDIPLKLVGDGPQMAAVQTSVHAPGLRRIEVLGQRDHAEVMSLMQGARCLIFPSEWYEGFGLAIAEAFACGLPVIASRLGAMAEIVENGRTGLHFSPGNPEDLAAKVEWAFSHSRELRAMGREARKEFEQKYTAERNYQLLMDIYSRAIRKP